MTQAGKPADEGVCSLANADCHTVKRVTPIAIHTLVRHRSIVRATNGGGSHHESEKYLSFDPSPLRIAPHARRVKGTLYRIQSDISLSYHEQMDPNAAKKYWSRSLKRHRWRRKSLSA